jgi:hypothetical protein
MADLLLSRKRGIFLVDHDVRIVLVACGAHNLLILSAAELVHGKTVADLRAVATEALG